MNFQPARRPAIATRTRPLARQRGALAQVLTGLDEAGSLASTPPFEFSAHVAVPKYLSQTYWWAYLHPAGVRIFERQWLVNLILWGNFARLRDAAHEEMGARIDGEVLQVACVYGDFTEKMARRLGPRGRIDVVDVAPVQLHNLSAKLGGDPRVRLHHQDSTSLAFTGASYDHVVLFFLLHEQPERERMRTLAQALRVTRPGGKLIIVDYHAPSRCNPFRYVMVPILKYLEPFAMDLWRRDIVQWLPRDARPAAIARQTYFGGLYQKVVVTR
jgi:ubiquinone/menaquinone biosynthesis C-methylase UbiE